MQVSQIVRRIPHTVRFGVLLLVGFGLLPLWIALLFVAYVAMTSPNSAAAAGWALVLAIPASGVTLLVAAVGTAIYSITQGKPKRKLMFSGTFVLGACLVFAMAGVEYSRVARENMRFADDERARVLSFVRDHPDVRRAAGQKPKVLLSSTVRSKSGPLAETHEVAVTGTESFDDPETFYAVVGVRRTEPASFTLLCTTPIAAGRRDSRKGPCEQ